MCYRAGFTLTMVIAMTQKKISKKRLEKYDYLPHFEFIDLYKS